MALGSEELTVQMNGSDESQACTAGHSQSSSADENIEKRLTPAAVWFAKLQSSVVASHAQTMANCFELTQLRPGSLPHPASVGIFTQSLPVPSRFQNCRTLRQHESHVCLVVNPPDSIERDSHSHCCATRSRRRPRALYDKIDDASQQWNFVDD